MYSCVISNPEGNKNVTPKGLNFLTLQRIENFRIDVNYFFFFVNLILIMVNTLLRDVIK